MARAPLTPTFAATTPATFHRAASSVPAVTVLAKLEERATATKERAVAHYKKFEHRWVAHEAIRIWEKHRAEVGLHPMPKGAVQLSADTFLKMAAHNVQARTNRRLSKINAISMRMGNAVLRNLNPPDLKRSFNDAAPEKRPIRSQTIKR